MLEVLLSLPTLPLHSVWEQSMHWQKKQDLKVIAADATNIEDLECLDRCRHKKLLGGKLDFVLHSIGMSVNVRKGKHYTDLNHDWMAKGWDVSAVSFHKLMQCLYQKRCNESHGGVSWLFHTSRHSVLFQITTIWLITKRIWNP